MQKNGRELDVEVPDFDKNYIFAQRLAKMGSTKEKDMPVINNKDVRLLQSRLQVGELMSVNHLHKMMLSMIHIRYCQIKQNNGLAVCKE